MPLGKSPDKLTLLVPSSPVPPPTTPTMKKGTKSGIDAASFFFFYFCLLKACAELMGKAVWQLKRPSGLGSGRGEAR